MTVTYSLAVDIGGTFTDIVLRHSSGVLTVDKVLTTNDLVSGEDVFVAATGVTTGALLQGVRFERGFAITESLVLRSRSGTVRRVQAQHSLEKSHLIRPENA